MKTICSTLMIATAATLFSQAQERPPVVTAPPPPPAPAENKTHEYEQRLYTPPAPGPLVAPEQAQSIVDRFKMAYAELGSPRLVIYVNRDLVDENSGLKLIARTEKVDTTTTTQEGAASNASTTENAARENRYRRTERKEGSLADRQTVRDVERLFGRPFRMAGARLADQRLATQLMPDGPLKSLATEGEQARKDREALGKIADVAIEVLVASKKIDVTESSGTRTYELPDIQVTAMRLKDAEIIGQASSSDVLRGPAATLARTYDVRQITEAVALALMEDMLPARGAVGEK